MVHAAGFSDPIITRMAEEDKVPWYKKRNLRLMYLWLFLCCVGTLPLLISFSMEDLYTVLPCTKSKPGWHTSSLYTNGIHRWVSKWLRDLILNSSEHYNSQDHGINVNQPTRFISTQQLTIPDFSGGHIDPATGKPSLTPGMLGFVSSCYQLGSIIGVPFAPWFNQKFGRRWAIMQVEISIQKSHFLCSLWLMELLLLISSL